MINTIFSAVPIYKMDFIVSVLNAVDTRWYVLFLSAFILTLIIQFGAKYVFNLYFSNEPKRKLSGREAAEAMMTLNDMYTVSVVNIGGEMTDNYNPVSKEICLSERVYNNSSISSVAIACHEAGHAIQFALGSSMVKVRNVISGILDLTTGISVILIIFSLLFRLNELSYNFVHIGIIAFSISFFFKLITISVELEANRRAINAFEKGNILEEDERRMAKKVLFACSFTYVASMLSTPLKLMVIPKKRK